VTLALIVAVLFLAFSAGESEQQQTTASTTITTYTYTTSTSYTTTTTTYTLVLLSITTTSTTTSVTATSISTSLEGITLLTTANVESTQWFSETTSTTITLIQTSTVLTSTVTVPTTKVTSASATIYSPATTVTSTTSTATTTTITSTSATTATIYSPTVTLTSTTRIVTTAFPLGSRQCLIASAAYGSELAEPVESLRRFRDKTAQSTFAGGEFMKVFNSFYYSFSPTIANVVASSELVATIMRIMLFPLIAILQASSFIFETLRFAPEAGMVAAGLFNSALLGAVYLTPIGFAARLLLRKISNVDKPSRGFFDPVRPRPSDNDRNLVGVSR
jgi:hypothetical protein